MILSEVTKNSGAPSFQQGRRSCFFMYAELIFSINLGLKPHITEIIKQFKSELSN